jgi:hypothetical protein
MRDRRRLRSLPRSRRLDDDGLHRHGDRASAAGAKPGSNVLVTGLIGQQPKQLEGLCERRIGGDPNLGDGVKLEPLQQ